MLIGIDASRANRLLRTGTEWYSFYIIQYLAKIDRENTYILYLDAPPAPDLAAAVASYSNVSFKILGWPWRYFWTLGRLSWEMLISAPDVLFVPAHSLPLIHPRRTINTIHDIAFVREGRLYQKKNVRFENRAGKYLINLLVKFLTAGRYESNSLDYLVWSTAYALKHASKIIAVSNFTKQEILDVYSPRYDDKIAVIYNGYPQHLYFPIPDNQARQSVLDKYGLEKPFFLYVGRLERKKNIPALVEAFSIFKEAHPQSGVQLVLIGNAGFGYDEVKYIAEENNLGQSLIMPGWVAEEDMPAIFSAAEAFIFPTLHEGFGIPVIQAMACGVPTLVSDLPVLREIAGEAAFYFNPRNRLEMAESLSDIFQNRDLRQALSLKGLEQAQKFNWEKSAQETLKILTARR